MRAITLVGEATKYLSESLKSKSNLPWKNIEKARDLLGHLSRAPLRDAFDSVIRQEDSPVHSNTPKRIFFVFVCFSLLSLFLFLGRSENGFKFVDSMFGFTFTFSISFLLFWTFEVRKFVDKNLFGLEEEEGEGAEELDSEYAVASIFLNLQEITRPPKNLLRNIVEKDFPEMKREMQRLKTINQSLLFKVTPSWIITFLFSCLLLFLSFSFSSLLPSNFFLPAFVVLAFVSVSLTFAAKKFLQEKRVGFGWIGFSHELLSAQEFWNLIPSSKEEPSISRVALIKQEKHKKSMQANSKIEEMVVKVEDMELILQGIDEEKKQVYKEIWESGRKMNPEEKEYLFSKLNSKEQKILWGAKFFKTLPNEKADKVKKAGETATPEERKKKRVLNNIKLRANNTLNRERGLFYMKMLRKVLQNPSSKYFPVKPTAVKWFCESIETLERTGLRYKDLKNDKISLYSLTFLLGMYALYAAQVKWYWPHLIGNEFVEMRGNAMHSVGHNFKHDSEDEAIQKLVDWFDLILSNKDKFFEKRKEYLEKRGRKKIQSKEENETDN